MAILRPFLGFLFHPILIGLIGVIAASLVIWFIGPTVAVGKSYPLEPAWVRGALIALLVVLFVIKRLWTTIRKRMANRKLMAGLTSSKAPATAAAPTESDQERQLLAQRFEDAVETLRKMRLANTRGGFASLIARSGKQYLYELPWYVFIGPPGSGKTTALVNSGLQFPLADKLGSASVKGVGGTRNCDWWFTDEAVLVDTAGRYTTQDSDQQVDKSAWDGFLDLLKNARPRRPINGIFLVISASDLLTQSARERATHAEAARARITELYERLAIRFPIYVLITKVDLLAGFTEFFADLSKEERAQVWGTSFTYTGAADAPDPLPSLDGEWDALVQRLFERLPQRLRDERDVSKRALIFGLPQQMAALKPAVTEYLGQVFVSSRFGKTPLLRGVYCTSGTQEGRPIDRVVGQVARSFGFESQALAMHSAGSGRSFFLTRLLRDVIFEEQALAGSNIKWERRRMLLQWAGYVGCAVLAVALLLAWTISYARNRAYVTEVEMRAAQVRELVTETARDPAAPAAALLPALDAIRAVPITDALIDGEVPLSMSFGLYQGDKLDAAAQQAYRNLLRNAFLPRLVKRVEQQLRSIPPSDLEQTYAALRVYLMMQDRSHLNADDVAGWIEYDWSQTLPRDFDDDSRASLQAHLRTLLAQEDYASPIAADAEVVASARAALVQYPLPRRIYSALKREGIGQSSDFPDFSVTRVGGPSASLAFARKSGSPLAEGVPGLYTYDGYHKAFVARVKEMAPKLAAEESWVLGLPAPVTNPTAALTGDDAVAEAVRKLYLNDYVQIWEKFVGDIRLKSASTLTETIGMARILSSPDSPLPLLMKAIVRETTLTKPQESEKDLGQKAADKIEEQKRKLDRLFGGGGAKPVATAADKPIESIVDDRFAALRFWVDGAGEGQPAPMNQAIELLNEVYTMLSNAETAVAGGNPPPPSATPNKVKAESGRMPEPIKSMLQDISATSTSLILGQARSNLSRGIQGSVGEFCQQAIGGRYPFTLGSTRDVTADDFAQLFGSGGKIDLFFQTNLANYVDISLRPWAFRQIDGVPAGYSGSLREFERADTIRKAYFRGAQTPSYRFEFKPEQMDSAITKFTLDIDGQVVSYDHGPVVPKWVNWPGPTGTSIVRLQVSPPGASGSGFTTEGPWALFRMFDKAQTVRNPTQSEKMTVTFMLDGRAVRFAVTAGSVQNPYNLPELRQFQCPRGLS